MSQFMPRNENEARVLGAMGAQREDLEIGWGKEFGPLVRYLGQVCFWEMGWNRLRRAVEEKPIARTMVITGERCTGAAEDGSDSPILQGMRQVLNLLGPHATKKPGLDRNGREPDALSVVFSGGQTLTRATGEFPGSELAQQFHDLTLGEFESYVQHENLSLNTGDQGAVLGGMVWTRNPLRVVVVHVPDHIARFAATLMEGWRANRDGRVAEARALQEQGLLTPEQVLSIVRPYPELHLLAVGDFEDIDPRRGANGGISRKREAFGPTQVAGENVIPGKFLGGEYAANRYGKECLDEHAAASIGYACRALKPSAMLELIADRY